jgi:hypothetical protein
MTGTHGGSANCEGNTEARVICRKRSRSQTSPVLIPGYRHFPGVRQKDLNGDAGGTERLTRVDGTGVSEDARIRFLLGQGTRTFNVQENATRSRQGTQRRWSSSGRIWINSELDKRQKIPTRFRHFVVNQDLRGFFAPIRRFCDSVCAAKCNANRCANRPPAAPVSTGLPGRHFRGFSGNPFRQGAPGRQHAALPLPQVQHEHNSYKRRSNSGPATTLRCTQRDGQFGNTRTPWLSRVKRMAGPQLAHGRIVAARSVPEILSAGDANKEPPAFSPRFVRRNTRRNRRLGDFRRVLMKRQGEPSRIRFVVPVGRAARQSSNGSCRPTRAALPGQRHLSRASRHCPTQYRRAPLCSKL